MSEEPLLFCGVKLHSVWPSSPENTENTIYSDFWISTFPVCLVLYYRKCSRKSEDGFTSQIAWVHMPWHLLNLSKPQFLLCKMDKNRNYSYNSHDTVLNAFHNQAYFTFPGALWGCGSVSLRILFWAVQPNWHSTRALGLHSLRF